MDSDVVLRPGSQESMRVQGVWNSSSNGKAEGSLGKNAHSEE